MPRYTAPEHVLDYCNIDMNDLLYVKLQYKYRDKNTYIYKIVCTCGCNKFFVYKDAAPSVYAECTQCKKMITVYDLAYYPAAIKLSKKYQREKFDSLDYYVYAVYEYSDEYMYEEDIVFDANDISWGKVFIGNNEQCRMIVDDETD